MLKRYDQPTQPLNPYPEPGTEIAGFRYDSAMVLVRLKGAIQTRDGEDANYLLGRPFLVSWKSGAGEWCQIEVPEGLITDLTSVPRAFRWFVGRVGPWLEAAVVHDYLYIAWQDVPDRGPLEDDRRFADTLMRAAMAEAKVHPLRIIAIFTVLRLFGKKSYRRRTSERFADVRDAFVTKQYAFRLPRRS